MKFSESNGHWAEKLQTLFERVKAHDDTASESISLIASGNTVSDSIIELMSTDLLNRAAEGRHNNIVFPGLEYFYQIENEGERDVAEVFGADFAELRPISGSQANLIVLTALTSIGDTILTPRIYDGGHISTSGRVTKEIRNYKFVSAKLKHRSFTIDEDDFINVLVNNKPSLVFLGGSVVTEAQDLHKMVTAAHDIGAVVVYDASHVAGLIASKAFKNPLEYGVDIMTMTTCKTIPGPSHAWIVGSRRYEDIIRRVVFPGFVSGGHLQEYVGALGALYELLNFEGSYGKIVVETANILGSILEQGGFSVIKNTKGVVTDTHQVMCESHSLYSADELQNRLEKIGILTNANYLPGNNGFVTSSGIRFGTQEAVWIGMGKSQVVEIGNLINSYLLDTNPSIPYYKAKVKTIRKSFKKNDLITFTPSNEITPKRADTM